MRGRFEFELSPVPSSSGRSSARTGDECSQSGRGHTLSRRDSYITLVRKLSLRVGSRRRFHGDLLDDADDDYVTPKSRSAVT